MSEQRKHNQPYTLSDIEQYLQGKLSPAEMHALEKAAVQDPFLADAIEGYQSADLQQAEQDLNDIRKKILLEDEQKKAVVIPVTQKGTSWWKIAAVILMVIGSGTLAWFFFNTGQPKKEMVQQQPPLTIKKDTAQPLTATVQQPALIAIAKRNELAANAKQKKLSDTNSGFTFNKNADSLSTASIVPSPRNELADILQDSFSFFKPIQTPALKPDASLALTGKVAGVQVTGVDQKKIFTDKKQAELANVSNIVGGNLSVLSARDKVLPKTAGDTETYNIQLKENTNSLNEVVVTGYQPQKKKDLSGSVVTLSQKSEQALQPVVGWDSLRTYLRRKINFDKDDKKMIYRDMELMLTIKKRKIIDVEILKSFNSSLNDIIIRALKDGPGWTGSDNSKRKQKQKVTISF
jgi:flagellar basal body-associated protein FliL